jgi:hypothetical protein
VIRNGKVAATLRWLYPDAQRLWRVTDSIRTTYYQDADNGQEVARQMRYRSMGPIHRAQAVESLLAISAGEPDAWSSSIPEIAEDFASLALSGSDGTMWKVSLDWKNLECVVAQV